MFRKAQAAMEFLMTYGWALLAVLVVIGALAYLGILDVETILPERCTFPVPLNCQESRNKQREFTIGITKRGRKRNGHKKHNGRIRSI